MAIVTTKDSSKVEVMAARFNNLVEEVNTLKLVFENILVIRAGLRQYRGCAHVGDSFTGPETSIKKRVAEIEDLLKDLDVEAKKFETFMKEPPQGAVQ